MEIEGRPVEEGTGREKKERKEEIPGRSIDQLYYYVMCMDKHITMSLTILYNYNIPIKYGRIFLK